MEVFAYCAANFREATRRAAGVEPLICPPASTAHFEPSWLQGRDLLYFDLHGALARDRWLGDDGIVALTAGQVLECDLAGTVVFATNCYLADEKSPMMDALLEAGAWYVIGGEGLNWAGKDRPEGASLLGWRFRQSLERRYDPLRALAIAKRYIRLRMAASRILGLEEQTGALQDSLAFRVYYRRMA